MTDSLPPTPTSSWTYRSERYRYATDDDIPAFAEMLADPEVTRWLWFAPGLEEQFRAYFAPLLAAQAKELAAGSVPRTAVFSVEDLTASFLGQGAVVAVEGSPGGFEIGFQLRREAWWRGVGTRLASFLCAYAVHRCDAYRIEGTCLEGNQASRTLLTRLGLSLEGNRPGYRVRAGTRHAELLYGAEVSQLDDLALLGVEFG